MYLTEYNKYFITETKKLHSVNFFDIILRKCDTFAYKYGVVGKFLILVESLCQPDEFCLFDLPLNEP